MSTQVMVSLPDDVYRRAQCLARSTGRDLNIVLADTLTVSLALLGQDVPVLKPVNELSDNEVLALSASQMNVDQDRTISELLDRQQAGLLSEPERDELVGLMHVYQEGLLRKAQALSEAVRRGLRPPLEP